MRYELVCLDLDGTLLNTEKKLLPQVRDAVRRAAAAGMKIVLGSARMPAGVESIEKELGVPCVKICDAGAYILEGETCICSRHLPAASMEEIYERYARPDQLKMWIFRDRDWYITGMDAYIAREIEIIGYHPETVDTKELASQWAEAGMGPSKLLLAADPEKIRRIQKDIQEQIEQGRWPEIAAARSADVFLEIFPKGVDKGTALQAVCDVLAIPPEKAIAFGDHEMDIPMLKKAGLGIAMGNAVDSLKEAADAVTRTNDEAGVAWALNRILDGIWERAMEK